MPYVHGCSTNRSFSEVDQRFALLLGDEMRARVASDPACTVIDIACGTHGVALQDIAAQYPRIRALGLDFQAQEIASDRVALIRGDMFSIPFKQVADVAYCAFVLADISGDTQERKERIALVTCQIAKTLRPGGIAFIDEATFAGRQYAVDFLVEQIELEHPGFTNSFAVRNHPHLGLISNYLVVRRNPI